MDDPAFKPHVWRSVGSRRRWKCDGCGTVVRSFERPPVQTGLVCAVRTPDLGGTLVQSARWLASNCSAQFTSNRLRAVRRVQDA